MILFELFLSFLIAVLVLNLVAGLVSQLYLFCKDGTAGYLQ